MITRILETIERLLNVYTTVVGCIPNYIMREFILTHTSDRFQSRFHHLNDNPGPCRDLYRLNCALVGCLLIGLVVFMIEYYCKAH